MILRAAFTIAALIFIAGCSKDEEASSDIPATPEDIMDAQDKALGDADPLQIKAGQFVYILKTQELHSSQEPIENLIEETAITVTEREEFGDYFDVTVIKEIVDYVQPDKPHYKFKNIYSIDYPAPFETDFAPKASKEHLMKQMSDKVKALAGEDEAEVNYYNLKVEKVKMSPPSKVLEHHPCAEGADCRINVTKLFFDVIVSIPGEDPQRNQFELWASSEVPYFATILKSCVMTVIKVDTALPLIRQCESVYDYRFEALPTP